MRRHGHLWLYALAFAAALAGLPWIGAEHVSARGLVAHALGGRNVDGLIFFGQRVPRVLTALLVGGSLAASGAALQVLFRNPLAEPWTLGVAGGAAVGAFLAHAVPCLAFAAGPLGSTQVLALAGAAAALTAVYGVAGPPRGTSSHTLLLGGVTISVLSGGLIMLIAYLVSPQQLMSFQRWVTGGVDVVGYGETLSLGLLAAPGLWLLFSQRREYNHLALGEELAMGHGVDVRRVRAATFAGAGLATAAAVALAGPIGFVGMLVPHAVRAISGADHRVVLPASFLAGGVVLAACDTVGRTALAPTEIPVGIIAAVMGAPLFLGLLSRTRP